MASLPGADLAMPIALAMIAIALASLPLFVPPVQATSAFARATNLPCNRCHAPAGTRKLTPFGEAFKANGNRLPADK